MSTSLRLEPTNQHPTAFNALTLLAGYHKEHMTRKKMSDDALAWLSV